LYSNLCYQFRRQLSADDARAAARGLAALIDGLWLRGALTGDAFDTDEALNIAYDYLDQQLAKQSG
ncbi:TetR family transcriptional regulator C-terminal domain-containing protein, partial [Pseudomonas aeruginosa]|nr:TetR family transcriptional regulator C-terminal domain-containing protein [Pseudomonas aeruginosa]